jgi:hypothetical protein
MNNELTFNIQWLCSKPPLSTSQYTSLLLNITSQSTEHSTDAEIKAQGSEVTHQSPTLSEWQDKDWIHVALSPIPSHTSPGLCFAISWLYDLQL